MIPINATGELAKYLGCQVGWCKVNKPWTYTQHFETAAWYEEHTTKPGIYPVSLAKGDYFPHHVYLLSQVEAEVTDDWFPALWGGNPIGTTTRGKNNGQSRVVRHTLDLIKSIDSTGTIPGNDVDVYVDPGLLPLVMDAAKIDLDKAFARVVAAKPEYDRIGDTGVLGPLSTIMYGAREIAEIAEGLDKLRSRKEHTESNMRSEHMRKCIAENLSWVPIDRRIFVTK